MGVCLRAIPVAKGWCWDSGKEMGDKGGGRRVRSQHCSDDHHGTQKCQPTAPRPLRPVSQ